MATKKKMLQAAAGAGGGEPGLNVEDVFSIDIYEGNGTGQAIYNGIELGQSALGSIFLAAGNNSLTVPDATSLTLGSGDFTVEFWWYGGTQSDRYPCQVGTLDVFSSTGAWRVTTYLDNANSFSFIDGVTDYSFSTDNYNDNAWHHVAVTRSGTTVRGFIDGVKIGTDKTVSTSFTQRDVIVGGQFRDNDFIDGYISNLRIIKGTALYTSAFTPPTEPLTGITNTVLLVGQGDSPFIDNSSEGHTITQNGSPTASTLSPFELAVAGEGGLVWYKERDSATYPGHKFVDTVRGAGQTLYGNQTNANLDRDSITSFNYNGFTIGDYLSGNQSGVDNVAWTFRKAPKFFDVVEFTAGASGTDSIIDHNLDGTVGMVITKCSSATSDWFVFHRSAPNKYLLLNDTNAEASWTWSSTSTQIDIGQFWTASFSGQDIICYIFAHNDGDGGFGPNGDQDIIKCGSFTSSSTVDLGFEPAFLLEKSPASSSTNWNMHDTMRGWPAHGSHNPTSRILRANLADAEIDSNASYQLDLTSTGFTVPSGYGDTVYIAIRRGLMGVPESGTEVFAVDESANISAGDLAFDAGFPVDAFFRTDVSTTDNIRIMSRLTGSGRFLNTNAEDTEASTAYMGSFDNNEGITTDTSFDASDYYAWMWRRAPNFCDVVAYESTGSAQDISHNLGAVPEMIWTKSRDNSNAWWVGHKALSPTWSKVLELQGAGASIALANIFGAAPTDTQFRVGNRSGYESTGFNIAYLFASVPGVSKVGSYTGDGTTGRVIDCGFTSGARFVLTRRTNTSGNWNFWDTERGIVAGNDPRLELNGSGAQDNGHDYIDPDSSGFIVNYVADDGDDTNVDGDEYIFYAIA